MGSDRTYPCPSCGFYQFEEAPGSFDICGICGWEDDNVQLALPGLRGGANTWSLKDFQDEILQKYPADVKDVDGVRRDPDWRPLHDFECIVTNPGIGTGIYYWKQTGHDSRGEREVETKPTGTNPPRSST